MRALLNASLRYGSRDIIVGVASVASRKELKLKTLHKKCGTPIGLRKWCTSCGTEAEETVKGWEQIPGSYLVLSEDELAVISPPEDKLITLDGFLPGTVGWLAVEKNYWLVPGAIDLGYWDLHAALIAEKKIGIGVSVLWGKESPCSISAVKGQGLLLSLLFYAGEVASFDAGSPHTLLKNIKEAREVVVAHTQALDGFQGAFTPPARITALLAGKMASSAKGKATTRKTVEKALKATTPKRKVKS